MLFDMFSPQKKLMYFPLSCKRELNVFFIEKNITQVIVDQRSNDMHSVTLLSVCITRQTVPACYKSVILCDYMCYVWCRAQSVEDEALRSFSSVKTEMPKCKCVITNMGLLWRLNIISKYTILYNNILYQCSYMLLSFVTIGHIGYKSLTYFSHNSFIYKVPISSHFVYIQ